MALLERLQILVDADAKGLLREFDKAGSAADKLDAKLKSGSEKTAARLQSVGSKTALGGVAVLGGLAALAKSSDEAEIQQIKLQNSIKNSNKAFSNGGKGLTDLAQGLQKVTAADGDAIVGAESLLVQFGLTENQVKTLAPLVVDLSRKYGIGLDQAAKIAGKAIEGNAGALKKLGINVDEAKLKADGFGTVVEALGSTVGGFARGEGNTFAGKLASLKNTLGDLGESVGKGAAGVFGALATDALGAVSAVNKLNPAILETVGAVGASGGLVATLAGGFAFAAGKAIDFTNQIKQGNTSLVKIGEDGEKSLTKVGKAAAGISIVSAVIGVVETVATISNSINQIDKKSADAFDGFRKSLKGTNADLATSFGKLVEVEDETGKFSGLWEGFGAEIKLGNLKADVEEVQTAFTKVLDTFGPKAAQKVIDGLKAQNAQLDENSGQYKTNAKFIEENQKRVDARNKSLTAATIAEREQKRATAEAVKQTDLQSASIDGISASIKAYEDKVKSLNATYDAAQNAAKSFGDQIERATSTDNIAGAVVKLSDGLRTLRTDIANLPSFADALDPTKISEAGGKSLDALLQFGQTATTYFQQIISAGGADLVPGLAEKYRNILTSALQNAGVSPDDIQKYLGLAGLDNQSITVAVNFAKNQQSLDQVKLDLELFAAELQSDPKTLALIKADVLAGDYTKALADLQAKLNAAPPVVVPSTVATPDNLPTGNRAPSNSSGNARDRSGRRKGAPKSEPPSPPSASLPPGRAIGGPMAAGTSYMVNERGPEMFVPTTSGFMLTSDDSKRLVSGVEQLLSSGGGQTFNITTTDPVLTAAEVVRRQRDAQFLLGR